MRFYSDQQADKQKGSYNGHSNQHRHQYASTSLYRALARQHSLNQVMIRSVCGNIEQTETKNRRHKRKFFREIDADWCGKTDANSNRAPAAAYESPAAKLYYDGYHQALGEACRRVRQRWGHGLLLDLHGQGAEPETIFRGTDNGKSVSDLERRFGRGALTGGGSILGQLVLKGYKIAPDGGANDLERKYSGGFTTRTYGSYRNTGIDAIQLELGTRLRQRANLKRTAADLAEAIAVFAKRYLPLTGRSTEVQDGAQPQLER